MSAHTASPLAWPICFGIETELGITVADEPDLDVVEESIRLVRAAAQHGLPQLWDYATEDPHVDARGFRVKELRQDVDEAHYFSQDAQREYSFQEIKSDLVLRNGARLYNDHAHPEYSTPECATLKEMVAHDKAGERILEECARIIAEQTGRAVRLYKNNTDFRGHSYGCHDNYLVPRRIPWERLVMGMTPFLVTRQIFAGAGKVGWECEDSALPGGYQISQRADFFTELVSIDTMNRRPLINSRDEPHADLEQWRRFHVILGDANLSEFATWLKIGTTALMLEALARDDLPETLQLADPLRAHRSISRDAAFKWPVETEAGKRLSAVDLQGQLADWVEPRVDKAHAEKHALFTAWRQTLEVLGREPLAAADRLDWAAKYVLLDRFREAEGLPWSAPWLQSLDLEYHLLDREHGLYFALEQSGRMHRILTEEDILHAVNQPPASTRAYLRGKCVQKFSRSLRAAHWDHLALEVHGQSHRLDLGRVFGDEEVGRLRKLIDNAGTAEDFVAAAKL
jgi:proteasome accessory factor A